MNKWLQGFAYRVPVGWRMFGMAGVDTILIAFLTVSSQAIRVAIMNPVESLRSE
jgi:putative ABC transport system permease protein